MKSAHCFSATLLTSLLFFIGLMISVNNCIAQTGTWTTLPSMLTARSYFAAAEWNGKIYVFGGATSPTSSSDNVDMYDINAGGAWEPKKKMPGKMCCMSAVTLGNKIYLTGGAATAGSPALDKVYEYDPVLDTFIAKTALPVARAFHSSVALNGEIYVIGGSAVALGEEFNTVVKYNPLSGGNWAPVAALNTPRTLLAAEVVDGKIYVLGGAFDNTLEGLATMEMFDPASSSWTLMDPNMQTGRANHGSGVANGKLFVFGGLSGSADLMSVEGLNIPAGADAWVYDAPMTSIRRAFASVEYNDTIYVMGGINGQTIQTKVEKFYPMVNAAHEIKALGNNQLGQNFPNPFSWETTIQYEVNVPGDVEITLHDVTGKLYHTLVKERRVPGAYTVSVNARDLEGGVYFYTMKTENGVSYTKKMAVLK